MKSVFLITTYNRAEECQKLINQLHEFGDVLVADDHTMPKPKFRNCKHIRTKKNNGKRGFWETVNLLFAELKKMDFDYAFFMPDDILMKDGFYLDLIKIFDDIRDSRKVCLSYAVLAHQVGKRNWTNTYPEDCGEVNRTQWTDLFFIANKLFFKALKYKLIPIKIDWDNKPLLGSGVGSQISRRLHKKRYSLYQTKTSYCYNQLPHEDSKMNPEERKLNPAVFI